MMHAVLIAAGIGFIFGICIWGARRDAERQDRARTYRIRKLAFCDLILDVLKDIADGTETKPQQAALAAIMCHPVLHDAREAATLHYDPASGCAGLSYAETGRTPPMAAILAEYDAAQAVKAMQK